MENLAVHLSTAYYKSTDAIFRVMPVLVRRRYLYVCSCVSIVSQCVTMLVTWLTGVVSCLIQHGRRWLESVDRFAGCSSGALAATVLAVGTDKISVPVSDVTRPILCSAKIPH